MGGGQMGIEVEEGLLILRNHRAVGRYLVGSGVADKELERDLLGKVPELR